MITLPIGDSFTVPLTVQDKSQSPISPGVWPPFDLTNCTILCEIFTSVPPKSVIASVTGSVVDGPNGLATVTLDRTTSLSKLKPGNYQARFIVQKGTDLQYTVVEDTVKVS